LSLSELHEKVEEKASFKVKLADLKENLQRLQSEGVIAIKEWKGRELLAIWPLEATNLKRPKQTDLSSDDQQKRLLLEEIESLEIELEMTKKEHSELQNAQKGTETEAELNGYIEWLHKYNELKDAGQILLGKLAELENTTTKEEYKRFDLDFED